VGRLEGLTPHDRKEHAMQRTHYLYSDTCDRYDCDLDWSGDESEVTCPDCLLFRGEVYGAHKHRRAEVTAWLSQIGAHVIQVKNLGAAMEARAWAGIALQEMTFFGQSIPFPRGDGHLDIRRAVRYARVALGEVTA
jgi:hypothetical protein